jgi:DNA-binding transcriptional MerR regulator
MMMVGADPVHADAGKVYTIEQVATRTGLTKRTLRYYEEVGLLPPTERTEGNYRQYSEADVQRIEHIKKLRDLLGFSLNATEVEAKLAQLDRSDELIQKQLRLIEQKIKGLEQMRQPLLEKLERHRQTRQRLFALQTSSEKE